MLDDTINKAQLLFGINQGGTLKDIRIEHAKRISEFDLPGYAIGGLAVGESHEEMYETIENILYIEKVGLYYLNIIDSKINTQRIYLRIMEKSRR